MDCPLIVIRGTLTGLPLEFTEDSISIYYPTDSGTTDITAIYFAPETKDFYKCRSRDIQLIRKLIQEKPDGSNRGSPL